jgi:HAD superfamily hydrolase (TIGR01490 family)
MSDSAAFFDLDKTIIATSSTLAMGKSFYAAGLISRRDVLKGAYARLVYHFGEVDAAKMSRLRDDLAKAVVGWDAEQVDAVIEEDLIALIDPLVYDEAAALIEAHHAAGRAVVIVSSSGSELVGPIGQLIGVDQVIASRMVIEDGKYTGAVAYYCFGPNKAKAMRAMAAEQGWDLADCFAYTDSGTDVPMLEAVGHPHAVNPDRTLRKEATTREWPILEFKHPVALRSRIGKFSAPSKPVSIAIAGAGVVAAAAGWQAARIRGRRAG